MARPAKADHRTIYAIRATTGKRVAAGVALPGHDLPRGSRLRTVFGPDKGICKLYLSTIDDNVTEATQAPPQPGISMSAIALADLAVHLRSEDNVAVAARRIDAGVRVHVNGSTIDVAKTIGMGHKIALKPICAGEAVYKYGQIIGFAGRDIAAGEHVHVHNVKADAFERDYAFCRDCPPPPAPAEPRFFQGYDRGDGRYGTRNYVAIISTVNCSA